MQEAVPAGQGALAAIIGLDEIAVSELCSKAVLVNEVLTPANLIALGRSLLQVIRLQLSVSLLWPKQQGRA